MFSSSYFALIATTALRIIKTPVNENSMATLVYSINTPASTYPIGVASRDRLVAKLNTRPSKCGSISD